MVVAVATLGIAIIAVKFGPKTAADLVGLVSFPADSARPARAQQPGIIQLTAVDGRSRHGGTPASSC
jgi:hypothetical protein